MEIFGFGLMVLVLTATGGRAAVWKQHRSIRQFQHTHPWLEKSSLIRNQYEKSSHYYLDLGREFVADQLSKKFNRNVAKNVILYLGDGMSITTQGATRMYLGAEEKSLSFEQFPFIGMAKTYCVDRQVADSACSASAYLGGVKANVGTIGVNAKVKRGDCSAKIDESSRILSIAKWALDAGKSVGLVTTTRVTHASPAGLYAHSAERDWESNRDVLDSQCDDAAIDDIAEQLVRGEVGRKLKVVFGGGRGEFRDQTVADEEGLAGRRTDNTDLIQEWLRAESGNRTFIWNKSQLLSLSSQKTDAVLGLFGKSHMKFNYEIDGVNDMIPTLSEMTLKAIDILKTNEKGFFLFVESGRIDHGHHDTRAHIALDETAEFAKAIDLALDRIGDENTLHVVTADHSHTLTYSGYADRHKSVFGIGARSDEDNVPYLKLSYANGNGFKHHKNNASLLRNDPSNMKVLQEDFEFPDTVPMKSETHGGDDVGIFATGPHSHLFKGVMEQNVMPHIMGYASCIGSGLNACEAARNV